MARNLQQRVKHLTEQKQPTDPAKREDADVPADRAAKPSESANPPTPDEHAAPH